MKIHIVTHLHRGLLDTQEAFLDAKMADQRFAELCKEYGLPQDDPIGESEDVYIEEVEIKQ